jgi:AcrR family transcriptional regulator
MATINCTDWYCKEGQSVRKASKRQAILHAAYGLFRARGFEKTSMAEIRAAVGGSKATIYSYFASKEELFVECVMSHMDDYMAGTLRHLEASPADAEAALLSFGASALKVICSPDHLEFRRLVIAEAARGGTGQRLFDKISSFKTRVSKFLSTCMATGIVRPDDPRLAAHHFAALLEAEILEPLLLRARENVPSYDEIRRAAKRAVDAFIRAYAPAAREMRLESA